MQAATATARGEIDKADKDKNVGEVPSDDWAHIRLPVARSSVASAVLSA